MKINQAHQDLEIEFDLSESNQEDLIQLKIADLNLPSGKIITSDPFFTSDLRAFSRTVTPGKYPVKIYLREVDEEHYRVAFAKIKFKETRATRWILAVSDDMDLEELNNMEEEDFFGFPVDAGLGCFIDEQTNTLFLEKMDAFYKNNPDKNYYDDLLAEEFVKYSASSPYSREMGDWNNHVVDEKTQQNVVMFASGWGDGYYPTYWGYNDKNETVELVIDFLLGEEEDEDDEE